MDAPRLDNKFRFYTSAELAALPCPPLAPEPAIPPTWSEVVAIEQRLLDAEKLAFKLHWRHGQDLFWVWYNKVKPLVMELAGWEAEQFALRTSAAYDLAYDYLLQVLITGKRPRGRPRDASTW